MLSLDKLRAKEKSNLKIKVKKNSMASAKNKKKLWIFLFLLPTLCAFCLFYLYPILTVFATSFAKWDYSNILKPEFYKGKELFTNYKYILTEYPYFWEALRNSMAWALCGVVIQVPIAVTVAIMLSKSLPGWKFARNVYIIPNIISTAAMGLIFLQIYNPRFGVINQIIQLFAPGFDQNILLLPKVNFWAMTFSYILFAGSSTIMILGQIFAIPTEIYEAATLDNITGWKREWYITLPLIKDTIKTVTILAATAGFLLYNEVYFLTQGAAGTKSISYIIRELAITSSRTQYARANTVGVIQILWGLFIIIVINLLFKSRKKEEWN